MRDPRLGEPRDYVLYGRMDSRTVREVEATRDMKKKPDPRKARSKKDKSHDQSERQHPAE
jgi:hypothetical protein